jgi:uncharacterized membrane protein
MRNLLRNEWLQLLILAIPFCVAAFWWPQLPARLPIHWNFRGEIDGYAGKIFGALFLPVINVVLVLLITLLPRFDPKFPNYDVATQASITGVYRVCRLAISVFLAALTVAILLFALQFHFDLTRLLAGGMGLLFAVIGNSMTKLRPNWFAGFRTPWSLESRSVWIKTHRLGGWLMVGCGLGLFVESLFFSAKLCFLAGVLPLIILVGIVPAAYSYFCYRAEKKAPEIQSYIITSSNKK